MIQEVTPIVFRPHSDTDLMGIRRACMALAAPAESLALECLFVPMIVGGHFNAQMMGVVCREPSSKAV